MRDLAQRWCWRGRTVAWESYGTGPPLVFCHGTPLSAEIWRPFADALATDFTVYLWDMPGYGRSSMLPEHRVDFSVLGELFADLLSEWEVQRPHVVAHDFGAAVSLRAHLFHDVAYRSMLLLDATVVPPLSGAFFDLVRDHPDVFAQLPSYMHVGAVTAYLQTMTVRTLRPEELLELAGPWLSADGQAAFYRQMAHASEESLSEIEARLGDVMAPVRIVWGQEDFWMSPAVAHYAARMIPAAGVVLIEGAGHAPQLEAAVALATELRAWLQSRADLDPGPAASG